MGIALLFCLIGTGGDWLSSAEGGVIVNNPGLPPVICFVNGKAHLVKYKTAVDVHSKFHIPAGGVVDLSNIAHTGFENIVVAQIGPDEREDFDSVLMGQASFNGGPLGSIDLAGSVSVIAFGKAGMTTGSFDTEMVSMSLTGMVGGNPVMIRESPTLASTGHTEIDDIGGGEFHIDSFFDVFVELTLDGGQTWIPSDGPAHVTAECPEPSTMVLFTGVALIGFGGRWRRRRLIAASNLKV
ncbi:MAG: PEP-CTERM sorting domain-containing protein [Planctomycetales bacterium]